MQLFQQNVCIDQTNYYYEQKGLYLVPEQNNIDTTLQHSSMYMEGGGGDGKLCSLAILHIHIYSMWMSPIFFILFFFYPCHVKQKLFCTLHVTFQEFKFFTIYFSFFRGHNGVRSAIASLGCDVRYIDNNVIVMVGIKRSPKTNLGQQHFIDFQCGFSKICPHFWDAHVLSTNMCGMWP